MLLRSYHCPLVLSLLRFTLYSSCSVKIRGPSFVIAKVCSYCADLPVSCVRAVHPLSRSEEHTSELQSRFDLVCRLLLEKQKRGGGSLIFAGPAGGGKAGLE